MSEQTDTVLEQLGRPDVIHARLCEVEAERRLLRRALRLAYEVQDELADRQGKDTEASDAVIRLAPGPDS